MKPYVKEVANLKLVPDSPTKDVKRMRETVYSFLTKYPLTGLDSEGALKVTERLQGHFNL